MKQNRKRLFISLLLLVCTATLTFAIYAAFTSSSGNFKRVVTARTQDAEENNALRFSSNYLTPYANGIDVSKIGTYPISVSNDSDVTIGIVVYNCPQNAQSNAWANDKDITYTISLKVLDSNMKEISGLSVTIENATGNQTLPGGQKSSKLHRITIPRDQVKEISKGYLQVIVRPDDASLKNATSNNILAANLQIIPASAKETAWNGVSGDNIDDFSLLDAFNYQISGTEQSTLTLTWNKEKVTLSDWSIKTLKPNVTETEMNTIKEEGNMTFSVGGPDQPTSYMLQFYRVGTEEITKFDDLEIKLTQTK